MIGRCTRPSHIGYPNYGGAGITICERWMTFLNFLEDMGERPPGTSLDRIDSRGNYEPGNCRWATRAVQNNNRRSNIIFEAFGERKALKFWASDPRCVVGYYTLKSRIKGGGWSPEQALATPTHKHSHKRTSHV